MMSKGRTHELVSHDVSAASFRAWLERDARVKPPKDFRLSDDWLRYVMKASLLLSPDASRKRSLTIEMRYVGRREARVQLWRENRADDVSSEAHGDVADDTAENAKGTGC